MRIYRLLGLLSVLAEVEHITVQELAVRFEVSRRTILRDIETLNDAGFPVASRSGRGGGVSILKGYRQDKRLLSREDIASLFTALDGLKSLVGDGSVSALLARLVPVPETDAPSKPLFKCCFVHLARGKALPIGDAGDDTPELKQAERASLPTERIQIPVRLFEHQLMGFYQPGPAPCF